MLGFETILARLTGVQSFDPYPKVTGIHFSPHWFQLERHGIATLIAKRPGFGLGLLEIFQPVMNDFILIRLPQLLAQGHQVKTVARWLQDREGWQARESPVYIPIMNRFDPQRAGGQRAETKDECDWPAPGKNAMGPRKVGKKFQADILQLLTGGFAPQRKINSVPFVHHLV